MLNSSLQLFPHLVAAKRKRESTADFVNSTADEDQQPLAKLQRIDFCSGDDEVGDNYGVGENNNSLAKTPSKRTVGTAADPAAAAAWQELVSPNKRVQFNMRHMPPTPGRRGGACTMPRRSILKTPLKTGASSPLAAGGEMMNTTPRKVVGGLATRVRLSSER